ncbi:hypothetical protein B0J17DRAFT_679846 [Rhizoctonia solani]|nr:hypothetical protein B0J17DRAFT_679846 [Rhizoctonia solani]
MSIYIAGLNIPISQTQALNAAGWASIIIWFKKCMPNATQRAKVEKEAGPIKSMPPGKQGQLISATHGLGLFAPIAAFVFSLPLTGFRVPGWLANTSLPIIESHALYVGLRLGACAATFAGMYAAKFTFRHLGSQWSAIGVRERPKIVKTVIKKNPMFWNWIFAPAFVLTAIAFASRCPWRIQEKVIENDAEIGEAYKQYKKEVPYRVIPYIW